LAPGQTVLLTFNLATSKLESHINYTIWAEASTVQDEINTCNNVYINGLIRVKILGDVNGDKIVDLYDLVIIAIHFGETYP
jgi:hypothetical protein